jgi:hypothetical protein
VTDENAWNDEKLRSCAGVEDCGFTGVGQADRFSEERARDRIQRFLKSCSFTDKQTPYDKKTYLNTDVLLCVSADTGAH